MSFFLLMLVVFGTVMGDLVKTIGVKEHGEIEDFRPGALGRTLALLIRNRWVLLSIFAYSISFFGFVGLVSVADLSFAVPATAAAYVVETLLAKYVLKEAISRERWAGAFLVALGVALISL